MTDALDPNASYEAAEIAELLFRSTLRSFNRHKAKRAREGFPAPISRWGKKVWSGAALIAWRDRARDAAPASGARVDFGAILDERARKVARLPPR